MPYIPKVRRSTYKNDLESLAKKLARASSKGELTYVIFYLTKAVFKNGRRSYTNISNAISCCIDAAEEIRRRYLNPYEDRKRRENGDV